MTSFLYIDIYIYLSDRHRRVTAAVLENYVSSERLCGLLI